MTSNLVDRNLLCYSESFGEFVLPPGIEDWKEIDPQKFYKVRKQPENWRHIFGQINILAIAEFA